jgi:protein involved in polysaccharide export with SLBB domain
MAQLIKKQAEVKFNVGDRVQFQVINQPDNYRPGYKTMYGTAAKVNKVTMTIAGVDGKEYKAAINEVKHYIDPFKNI